MFCDIDDMIEIHRFVVIHRCIRDDRITLSHLEIGQKNWSYDRISQCHTIDFDWKFAQSNDQIYRSWSNDRIQSKTWMQRSSFTVLWPKSDTKTMKFHHFMTLWSFSSSFHDRNWLNISQFNKILSNFIVSWVGGS